MEPSRIAESNRDIATRAFERGVAVIERPDEICLYCGEADNVIEGYAGRGLIALLEADTAKLVGLVITDYERWAFEAFPVLRLIWRQYKAAKRFRRRRAQAEAAARLFHATACVALPELAPAIFAHYPEREPVPVPLRIFFDSLRSLLQSAFLLRAPVLEAVPGRADEPIGLELVDGPEEGIAAILIPTEGTVSVSIDWSAFHFDLARPAQVALWAEEPPPPEVLWDDWLLRGVRIETIAPGELDVRIPLTSRGHAIPYDELEELREWMATKLRLVGPWQQETL